MISGFTFRTASEEDLKFLILWMENNHDAIGNAMTEEIEEWIDGIHPPFASLNEFIRFLEWQIEAGAA